MTKERKNVDENRKSFNYYVTMRAIDVIIEKKYIENE